MSERQDHGLSVFRSFGEGVMFLRANLRVVLSLTVVPFIITFIIQRLSSYFFAERPFLSAVAQLPAEFALGAMSVILILAVARVFVYEAPSDQEEQEKDSLAKRYAYMKDNVLSVRLNTDIITPAIAFTFVSFLFSGLFAAISTAVIRYQDMLGIDLQDPQAVAMASPENAPETPLWLSAALLFVLVALIWALRFLWLHIFITLSMPVRQSYARLGGFLSSAAIGFLYTVSLLSVLSIANFLLSILFSIFGINDPSDMGTMTQFVQQAISIYAVILGHVVFSAASAFCVLRYFSRGQFTQDHGE